MRVITGMAKGRKLFTFADINKQEKGQADGQRPTSDYIKEAVFSRIQFDIEGRTVLDLFAGTGQLGIEALSRGAAFADFVDTDIHTVKKNVEITGFVEKSVIIRADALAFIKTANRRYDLVFLDPPYKSALLDKALHDITAIDILNIGGIIVCESQKEYGEFTGYDKSVHRYADKVITLYRRYEV